MLGADIARCRGQRIKVDGEWTPADQCQDCRRRTDPAHERQVFQGTPESAPCRERIRPEINERPA